MGKMKMDALNEIDDFNFEIIIQRRVSRLKEMSDDELKVLAAKNKIPGYLEMNKAFLVQSLMNPIKKINTTKRPGSFFKKINLFKKTILDCGDRPKCVDEILVSGCFIGSGEFSDAFNINGNIVLKRNRNDSLYNPGKDKKKFLLHSEKEMRGEIKINNEIKRIYPNMKLLPKYMEGFKVGDRFYILREGGQIPVASGRNVCFTDWKKDAVKRKNYGIFTRELFQIARDLGRFEDTIQPALRENGDLFLIDLGHFMTKKEAFYKNSFSDPYKRKKLGSLEELEGRIDGYEKVESELDAFGNRIGLKYETPLFVIEDKIILLKQKIVNNEKLKSITERAGKDSSYYSYKIKKFYEAPLRKLEKELIKRKRYQKEGR